MNNKKAYSSNNETSEIDTLIKVAITRFDKKRQNPRYYANR